MKNIDPNKVSNFKNHQPSYYLHSSFCMKTKPNNRYFNGEVKRLNQQRIDNFCTEELKKENPALYYCRLGRKLPKATLEYRLASNDQLQFDKPVEIPNPTTSSRAKGS